MISTSPVSEGPGQVIPCTQWQQSYYWLRIEAQSVDGVERPPDGSIASCDEDDALWHGGAVSTSVAAAISDSLAQPEGVFHLGLSEIDNLQRVELSSKGVEEGGPVVVARLGVPDDEKRLPPGRTFWTRDLDNAEFLRFRHIPAGSGLCPGENVSRRDDELGEISLQISKYPSS